MTLGNLKSEATSFLNRYKSESPAAYAAAEQAVGGLLILDGFVGIDNPLGNNKRPGIFGSLFGIAFGLVFFFVPTFVNNVSGVNKLTSTTSATVVSVGQPQVSSTTNSNGTHSTSSTCSATVKYTVNGKEYTQAPIITGSDMCGFTPGRTVQINYDPNNPGAWATSVGSLKTFLSVFKWAGVFIIVMSFFTFLVRLASIIFGWKLLRSGRALAKTLPAGTDLSLAIKQIEHEFKTSLFGFGGGLPTPVQSQPPVPQPTVPAQPTPPQPTITTEQVTPPQPPAPTDQQNGV